MKMTQTAIEWLIEQCPRIETIASHGIIQQAKEIEKEQMSHFYYIDRLTADVEIGKEVGWEFEEEYNKKYNK